MFGLSTETGTWRLFTWFPAVWPLSGGQIQRHFPGNLHCDSEAAHAAQVHSLKVFVDFLNMSLSYNFCTFIFRILVQICKTKAFQKLNPAEFDLRDEIKEAILVSNKHVPA